MGESDHGKSKRRGHAARDHHASTPHRRASFVSLISRPGAGSTRPVFLDGPAGLAGLDIHEPLFRFDANVHVPTRERGVSSANHVGEPLATIQMRWRPVADGFLPERDAAAPITALHAGVSQNVVMQDGTITFTHRGQGTLRFHGAGRTYPATTDGHARLFFAGAAVIAEGTGSLKGARGTLLVVGDVYQSSSTALTIVGRLDAGAVTVDDTLAPLVDDTPEMDATILTLLGETDPSGIERLRVARIGNDVASGGRLRSLLRVGQLVGETRTEGKGSKVLTFTDPAGIRIGSITAVHLEGTPVAFGAATRGTGALTGAGGVIAVDTHVDAAGSETTLCVLRLADPKGRFRAAYADVYKPMPAAAAVDAPPPPAPPESLAFVDGPAGYMSDADAAILRYAERSLADGMELAAWWEAKNRTNAYAETFEVVHEHPNGGRSFGFFDTAAIANTSMPVMGIVQEMSYDRQKTATGEAIRDQLKEFVLRYFMRVSHLGQPGSPAEHAQAPAAFGYKQLYYKRCDSSKIGKFLGADRSSVVDLRDIGTVYDWIVLEVDLFDFNLSFAPFGSTAPRVQMPLTQSTFLVIGPPFIKNVEAPEPGVLGQYGFGYAFVPYAPGGAGLLAYGPGHFAAAIHQVDFTVMADGEIRVRAAFVVNRPGKIAQVDFDPIEWGFKLADLMTFGVASRVMSPVKELAGSLPLRISGLDPISTYLWMANAITNGMAAKHLGHSKAVLEKRMLAQHFVQHHALLTSSLLVWRMVADWKDHERLPAFCREGVA